MKYKQVRIGLILFFLFGLFLQLTSKFHFFYIEQLQLFQFSKNYLTERLNDPGGLSLIISEFLTQFFITPYMGALIVSAILTIIAIVTRSLVRQVNPAHELPALYLLPSLTLLLIQYDFNYRIQGTIAFIFCLLTLRAWCLINDTRGRIIGALAANILLFWIGGPIACLFTVIVILESLLQRPKESLFLTIILLEYILIAMGSVWSTLVTDYRFAFLPDAFYHPMLKTPSVIYFSWISLITCLIGSYLSPHKAILSKRQNILEISIQIITLLLLCRLVIPHYNDAKSYPLKKLDYYVRTQQWEQIINNSHGPINNYLHLNYLNMALMEKGLLADQLFSFDQHGPQGLLVSWNKTFSVSTLLSDVYFSMGEIALSQEMAFEAYITAIGSGNPRNLQRLIQTNLIFGAYPIAEKYITLLEKTYGYRKWAQQHRRFLYSDKIVEADSLLGAKRNGLPKDSYLCGVNGFEKDLLTRADQNPGNSLPLHVVGCYFLLRKDLKAFKELLIHYYDKENASPLPISFQEAVILIFEKEPDYWKRLHVTTNVIQKFSAYRDLVLRNRNNPQLPQLIKQSFGDTYWSYFTLK